MRQHSRPSQPSPATPGRRLRRRGCVALVTAVLAVVASACSSGGDAASGGSLRSVMGDQHAHSLRVDPGDPGSLLLGLHGGLYRSTDAGSTWRLVGLEGDDAMNVVGVRDGTALWVAGHNVLERSLDAGTSFAPVRPAGLPNLDLHGFAVREGDPSEIYAAAAGEGLFRSEDGGESFELVSREVGPSVFGLVAPRDGSLLAADPAQGFLVSSDAGRSFRMAIQGQGLVSVAAPEGGDDLVVVGGDPGVYVSRDGARTFSEALREPVAAVAIAPSDPKRIYAVGSGGVLFASDDSGRAWTSR